MAACGRPTPISYHGGLDDSVFDAFRGHFQDVLKEPGVPAKIAEVMPLFHGARNDMLSR